MQHIALFASRQNYYITINYQFIIFIIILLIQSALRCGKWILSCRHNYKKPSSDIYRSVLGTLMSRLRRDVGEIDNLFDAARIYRYKTSLNAYGNQPMTHTAASRGIVILRASYRGLFPRMIDRTADSLPFHVARFDHFMRRVCKSYSLASLWIPNELMKERSRAVAIVDPAFASSSSRAPFPAHISIHE